MDTSIVAKSGCRASPPSNTRDVHGALSEGVSVGSNVSLDVTSIGGECVFTDDFPLTFTLGMVKEAIFNGRGGGPCGKTLVYNGQVLANARALLKDLFESDQASLTVVNQLLHKIPASRMSGSLTYHPSYLSRVNEGSDNEYLHLKTVCRFEVRGNFTNVPAGGYALVLESRHDDHLMRNQQRFHVEVWQAGVRLAKRNWDPGPAITAEFQEFEEIEVISLVVLPEPGDLHVNLVCPEGNWKSGFYGWQDLKAMYLK